MYKYWSRESDFICTLAFTLYITGSDAVVTEQKTKAGPRKGFFLRILVGGVGTFQQK